MTKADFILASSSPRRRELLNQLGLDYRVLPIHIDETPRLNEDPCQYCMRMAMTKAIEGWEQSNQIPVLAADTICVLDQEILGKPESIIDAHKMLGKLSGRTHTVITAVSLYNKQHYQRISKSQVGFKALSIEEIQTYCLTQEPIGKAGSYAIQGHAAMFITTISGSYSGNRWVTFV